jgi:hypothetical protein
VGDMPVRKLAFSVNASMNVGREVTCISSDEGLIQLREFDEKVGFGELIEQQQFIDTRAKNSRICFADLLRQSVYGRMGGFDFRDDSGQQSQDPWPRPAGSEKVWENLAAQPATMHNFETGILAEDRNLRKLALLNRELVRKAEALDAQQRVVLAIDSIDVPVYGEQDQSAYNDYFQTLCYHPLLLFNANGYCLAAKLRSGNVYGSEGWNELLLPEIELQQILAREVVFWADALCAKPEIYEALEERGVKYVIRVTANESVKGAVLEPVPRGAAKPRSKPMMEYEGQLNRADGQKVPLRVVASVDYHPAEPFPKVELMVTNLSVSSRSVVRFYCKEDTTGELIEAGKQTLKATRLSCQSFRSNEVRFALSVLAYNMGKVRRKVLQPYRI